MKKITLIAPSSPVPELTPETIETMRQEFLKLGYQIHLASHCLDEVRYLAGSDEERAHDVMAAFLDDETDIVMTLRGGYGSPRILDKLDYREIAKHPKPFYTISDGTALQTALYTKAGISGYSGIQGLFLLNDKNKQLVQTMELALQGKLPEIPVQKVWATGEAKGIAVGGNLSVLDALIGTPYFPDMTGKILVIEDINEYPYKVDRMLSHLRLSGVLDQVSGIVLGDFSACLSKDEKDGTIEDVFHDYFDSFQKPVVRINYGHRNRETVVPIGKTIKMTPKIVKEIK